MKSADNFIDKHRLPGFMLSDKPGLVQWPASTLATFSTESPLSMAIPPTLTRRRCFKFDTPPSGKAPRQPPTSTAVSLRRRAGAGFAVICEVSAAPAPSRSTFFCSGIQHLNHPLFSGLEWRLKKSEAGDIATQYEKAPQNFMAMVKLAAVRIWIKYYELAACQCRNPDSEIDGLPGDCGQRPLQPEYPKRMMKYACRDFRVSGGISARVKRLCPKHRFSTC